jgi:hypothetical protein
LHGSVCKTLQALAAGLSDVECRLKQWEEGSIGGEGKAKECRKKEE